MDPRYGQSPVDLQEQTRTTTIWPRLKIMVVATFLGFAVGVAVWSILDAIGGPSEGDSAFAAGFLGLMVAWAFNILGSHLVKIWALLSDHSTVAQHSTTS
jgi:hypothetical protein